MSNLEHNVGDELDIEENCPVNNFICHLTTIKCRFISMPLGTKINALDFGNLLKENSQAKEKSSLCDLRPIRSELTCEDLSTRSCLVKNVAKSSEKLSSQSRNTVTFCDYSPQRPSSRGIIKIGSKARYSGDIISKEQQAFTQSNLDIPPWGRDWDALEKRENNLPPEPNEEKEESFSSDVEPKVKKQKKFGYLKNQLRRLFCASAPRNKIKI